MRKQRFCNIAAPKESHLPLRQKCLSRRDEFLKKSLHAHVAELVDAADSKSAIRKDVKVRFLSWAHFFYPYFI
jgi:hypothetical protein